MKTGLRAASVVREYWLILLVAVGVALVYTLVVAFLNGVHKVDAESTTMGPVTTAQAAGDAQVLGIDDWGVQLTLPLASAMPLVSYAKHDSSSVGLSSADLQKLGPLCAAGRDALGSLVRLPAGTFDEYSKTTASARFVASIGGYDYAYWGTSTDCASYPGASQIISRELAVLYEALSTFEVRSSR